MWITGYVIVTLGTLQVSVYGLLKRRSVYVTGHAFLSMAIQTGFFGSSRQREHQVRNNEEKSEVLHERVIHDNILAKNYQLSSNFHFFFKKILS